MKELNFIPGGRMPSMYFHKELKLLLVIYVDDLKLAGPKENLAKGWEMLRSKLKIEPETDLGLYLGCLLSKGSSKLHDGTSVSTMTYMIWRVCCSCRSKSTWKLLAKIPN